METLFENIGLLIFIFFIVIQFVASLLGNKTKGQKPPSPEGTGAEGAPTSAPTSFEEAIRQIQEALQESRRPKPSPAEEDAKYETTVPVEAFPDEENSPAFQHFEDFEQRGEAHFDSGAHDQFEAAAAEREAMYRRPLKTERPTAMEQAVSENALRGQRSMVEVKAPRIRMAAPSSTPSRNTQTLRRLQRKLRSPEAVKDAYRLHVILGEPRAKRRR